MNLAGIRFWGDRVADTACVIQRRENETLQLEIARFSETPEFRAKQDKPSNSRRGVTDR